ncbi:MAG: hypothetical protein ACP5E4_01695 [Candidatus Aenigmatarchaeota archaeon]
MMCGTLKGDICDYFVRRALGEITLVSPYSASLMDNLQLSIKPLNCRGEGPGPMEKYKASLEGEFGSSVLPAYLVGGKKVFIEVSLEGRTGLKNGQSEEFLKVLKKGYRIFILAPKLSMGAEKIVLSGLECREFLAGGKTKKCGIEDIRKAALE